MRIRWKGTLQQIGTSQNNLHVERSILLDSPGFTSREYHPPPPVLISFHVYAGKRHTTPPPPSKNNYLRTIRGRMAEA